MVHHFEVESHMGSVRLETCDQRREEVVSDRLAASQPDRPPPNAPQVLDLRAKLLDFGNLSARVADEHFACRRQPHAARPTFEKGRPQLRLEVLDAPVHRRGGQVEALRRLADRPRPGDFDNVGEQLRVTHRVRLQCGHFGNAHEPT